jgi:PKD repeat protein
MSQRPAVPDASLARGGARRPLLPLLSFVLVGALCLLGAPPAHAVSTAPGWPVASPSGARPASALADLDGDGDLEVIHPASDSRLYVYHHDGTLAWLYDWQVETGSGSGGWGSPAVGDIDGDGAPEIVVTATSGSWAFHGDGSVVAGWPVKPGAQATPALADLDGDGILDVVTVRRDATYPNTSRVIVCRGDGTMLAGWPQALVGGVTDGGPAVADIDADGGLEVVVATVASAGNPNVFAWHADGTPVAGWPCSVDGGFYSTPALGSLDGGPELEVVLAGFNGRLYALHADGSALAGWPQIVNSTGRYLTSSPALADLDGDGALEAIIGSYDYRVCAYKGDGSSPAGWPVTMPGRVDGSSVPTSPAVGDIDGDGAPEVIIATNDPNYRLYAINHDGSFVAGWPPAVTLTGATTAVIADLDMDGDVEVVLGASPGGTGSTYVFSCDLVTADQVPWPMFAGNAQRTGAYAPPVIAPVADFAADPQSGLAPLTVAFTDLSVNSPTSWLWDFGDGGGSVEQNPTHVYADAGSYTVSLTAMNAGGADSEVKADYIVVISPDVTPPVLSLPADIVAEAVGPDGAVVTFTVSASDDMDPSPLVTVNPGSGSLFPLGVTTVNCAAVDSAGNRTSGEFTVTVVDTTPPVLVAPADVTAEATGVRTSVALGLPVVADAVDASPIVTNDAPAEGFPLGVALVTWRAQDASGNASSAVQQVTIVDTTPPALQVPAAVSVITSDPNGTAVDIGMATASDVADPAPVITNDAPAVFPVGVTTVTWTATDASGNAATGTQTVTVTLELEHHYANFTWLAPISNADRRLFKRGSTIPLKFRLTDLAGNPAPGAVAQLTIRYLVSGAPEGEPQVASTAVGDSGSQFRYSASDDLYIYNLSTKDQRYLNYWYYAADVTLDDGSVYSIEFSLK